MGDLVKINIIVTTLFLSLTVGASIGDLWSLNTGRKHPLFQKGENLQSLENKVFSKTVSFKKKWRLVDQVAGLKQRPQAIVFLKKCLNSNEWFLQSAALKVLKKKYPDVALQFAQKVLLNSNALVVRSEAVAVISELGGPKETQNLWKALKQSQNFKKRQSLWIRSQIVKTILKMERSNHSEKWVELLTDSDEEIRMIAKKVVLVN